ncbi:hypothetical protein C8R30_11833 [Nitrosomonas nitrosa]|uniref:hypothetical protein n=1 Tax=Nitrosomonas nitrosa TaxID=52442 RepID=UPI000B86AD10|nr:hypothetical protein [Nitrosomonas nitrosa]MCO6432866.1 hypothetical protein [Nitrosomonas nitrosa]PTQ93696.1 hypothetical protein C8R30_11833 [Nitrosomonas nitrosa]
MNLSESSWGSKASDWTNHDKFVLPLKSKRPIAGRVRSHTKIVEDQTGIAIQLLHFLRDAGFSLGDELNNTTRETS